MSEWHFIALFAKTKGIFSMYRHWCVISALRQMSAVSRLFIPNYVFFQTLLWQVWFSFPVCWQKPTQAHLWQRRMHQPDDSWHIDDVIFWSVFALKSPIGLLEGNIIPLKDNGLKGTTVSPIFKMWNNLKVVFVNLYKGIVLLGELSSSLILKKPLHKTSNSRVN